ncbi:restriction endonuclease subunit S [uncultured Nocardioides sp.]|uniref:restriction endonuclease subunit S n=1 Tax=uncultured Nocardioides sp. TaxID=198441 RepID=UPI00260B1B35|nr:restriction endonuclease subunit S [uncultured Nocardioides sp.]
MSEWRRTALGDVMALDLETVDVRDSGQYPVVGVLNRGRGLLYRQPIAGTETQYKTLNLIRPGQVVYSRLKAFEGAITVAPADLGDAFASQEFPTFSCGPALLPGYFRLLTTTPDLWDDLQNLSTGMGGRRERVKPADFLTLRIPLPPLAEQRRIVDVMAAVDAQIEALEAEVAAIATTLQRARDTCVRAIEAPTLSDLLDRIESGRSQVTDGDAWVPGAASILKVSAVQHGKFQPHEAKFVADAAGLPEIARVNVGDLLITRSNTPDRVGFAAVVDAVEPDTFMPDLVWRLVPKDSSLVRYLGHALASSEMRARVTGAASGTSMSMRKINKRSLGELRLPLMDEAQRGDYTALCDALSLTLAQLDSQVRSARSLRSAVLSGLLSQQVEIPESYDVLLDDALEVSA